MKRVSSSFFFKKQSFWVIRRSKKFGVDLGYEMIEKHIEASFLKF